MGRRFVFFTVILAVCGALGAPPAVAVGGLGRPVDGAVLLRFGVSYCAAGRQVTHRGIDLAAAAGDSVAAAAEGEVTFAGQVPADGGGRTCAVTVRTNAGLLVTVTPLERALVRQGDPVVAGDILGTLAAAGDASSADAHVHLSVREDGVYIDPEPALAALPTASGAGGATYEGGGADAGASATAPGESVAYPAGSTGVVTVAESAAAPGQHAVVGYGVATAPLLTTEQIARLRRSCAVQVAVLQAGHGRPGTTMFAEPSAADLIVRSMPRGVSLPPVRIAGAVLLGAVGCVTAVAMQRRRMVAAQGVGWRA